MWAGVLLYSLVGLTVAENDWEIGQQYKYNLEARTLTGQHQATNQFTGSIIHGELQIFVDSENQLTLQVLKAKYADINHHLREGWASYISETDVNYRALPSKNKPFQVHFSNGLIKKMVIDGDVLNWELNFLKGIASQFQVDAQVKNLKYFKRSNESHDDQSSGMFSTMEESINGKYEVAYEVSVLPEYVLQNRPELAPLEERKGDGEHYRIVKTRNFSNSDEHVYRFGMSGQEDWTEGTNNMGNFLTRTSQSTVVYSGNHSHFTIQSAETTEIVLVAPHMYNNQKAIVASRMSLSLKEISPRNVSSPSISNPKTVEGLAYEYEDETIQVAINDNSSSSSEESSSRCPKGEEEETTCNSNEESKINEIKQNLNSSSQNPTSNDSTVGINEEAENLQADLNLAPYIQFFPGNMLGQQRGSEQISKKIEKVAKKIRKLFNNANEIPSSNALSWFSVLTRLVMSASTGQLLEATEKLYRPEEKSKSSDSKPNENYGTWQAYRDSVAEAGSGPALVTLASWIKSGKVRGNEAAQLLATLPRSARYPTTEYMNYFFELVTTKDVLSQKYLNDSAILSFTDLVRRSQVDRQSSYHRYHIYPSRDRSKSHYTIVGEKYIPYLQHQLENAIAQEDSIKIQVYIRALGNTAHPKILSVFEPYLEEKGRASNFERVLMIASLDEFIKVNPKTARSVLYRIYQNQFEVPELRVAAVMQIIKSNPSAHLLQRMAEHTNYDQSKQVNAAVKSAIETAAKSDKIADPNLANNARSAMPFLSQEDYGARFSKHFVSSYNVRGVENVHYTAHGTSIQGTDGIYPDSIIFSQNYNLGGYLPEGFTASYMTSGAEQIVNALLKQLELNNNPKSSRADNMEANEKNNSGYSFQYISDILNWQGNEPIQIEGNIFGSVLGGKRLFPFDSNVVKQLPEFLREINENLQKGIEYQESKLYNQYTAEIGFPLATGVPFIYSISVPMYLGVALTGNGYLHQTQEYTSNKIPISGGINGKLKLVWSNQKRGEIGFIGHHSQQRYLTGLEKSTQLYLPIKGDLDMNWYNFRASFRFLDDKNDFQKIFQSMTNVYTTYQNISDINPYLEGSNVQLIQVGPKRIFRNTFGDRQTGYNFHVESASENNFESSGKAFYTFLQQGPGIFSDILYGDIINNYFVFSYDSKNSSPHETTISLTYKDEGPEASKMVREISKKKSKGHKDLWKSDETEDQDSPENISTKEAEGNYTTPMYLLAASISFGENQENGRYVATLVHAGSPISATSRYIIYYSGKPFHKSEDSEELQATAEIIIHNAQVAIFNFDDALNVNSTMVINGEIIFNELEQSKLAFQGVLLQSDERKLYLRNLPSAKVCKQQMKMGFHASPICSRLIETAHILDKYDVSIRYEDLPTVIKKMGQSFYEIVRHYGFDYNTEEVVDVLNEEDQINLGVQLTDDIRQVNVSMKMPSLQSYFQNIPVADWARPWLLQNSRYSPLKLFADKMVYSGQTPTCSLEANTISTFNNKSYPIKLGDCYHVLAMSVPFKRLTSQETSHKYDYDQRNFTILVKDVGAKKKMVQVLLSDDVITIEPTGSKGIIFSINGRKVQISQKKIIGWLNGKNELRVYTLKNDKTVILDIKSHGMELIYDGESLRLSMSSHYSNKVRGLCGVFDGELSNDFTTPGNCIMKTYREFTASYAINDDTCQGPAKEMHILARNVPCYPKEFIFANVITDQEAGRLNQSETLINMPIKKDKTSCYVFLTKTLRDGEKTCFSIRPQLLCNFPCKITKSIQKSLDFICLPDSAATKHWLNMINNGKSPDFTNKKPNRRINISLPQNCDAK